MRALALVALLVMAAARPEAHAMPNSTVVIAPTPAGLAAFVTIPLSELEAALGRRLDLDRRGPLETYLRAHISAVSEDGHPWAMTFERMAVEGADHPTLALTLDFAKPEGPASGAASLRYDAVNHRVASHYVLIYRREGETLRPLGRLQFPAVALPIGP